MRPKIAPIQEQQYDAAPQYSSYYSKPHYADGNMHYMAPVPVEAPGQRDMAEADGTSRPAPPPAEMEGHAVGSTR